MYNISKELFEAVTGEDTGNIFEVYYNPRIDINSFFFKCKKWALKQGYHLVSCTDKCHIQKKQVSMDMHIKTLMSDSEQQAVFDACQYILEQLKDN